MSCNFIYRFQKSDCWRFHHQRRYFYLNDICICLRFHGSPLHEFLFVLFCWFLFCFLKKQKRRRLPIAQSFARWGPPAQHAAEQLVSFPLATSGAARATFPWLFLLMKGVAKLLLKKSRAKTELQGRPNLHLKAIALSEENCFWKPEVSFSSQTATWHLKAAAHSSATELASFLSCQHAGLQCHMAN